MTRREDVLDQLSTCGRAAFATNPAERIVYWNRECEVALGIPAEKVLGRHCYEVVAGRDVFGNVYCSRSCPVANEARLKTGSPVHPFVLTIRNADGISCAFRVRMYAVPAIRPELSTVVHVLQVMRDEEDVFENASGAHACAAGEPRWSLSPGVEAPREPLTSREREILQCLAAGMPTREIANKLFVSPITIRNHIQRILEKLDCHTKMAAVAFAYRHNLVD